MVVNTNFMNFFVNLLYFVKRVRYNDKLLKSLYFFMRTRNLIYYLFENWAVERRFLLPIYVFFMLWNGYFLDLDQCP